MHAIGGLRPQLAGPEQLDPGQLPASAAAGPNLLEQLGACRCHYLLRGCAGGLLLMRRVASAEQVLPSTALGGCWSGGRRSGALVRSLAGVGRGKQSKFGC
jgi:hypothetical protein